MHSILENGFPPYWKIPTIYVFGSIFRRQKSRLKKFSLKHHSGILGIKVYLLQSSVLKQIWTWICTLGFLIVLQHVFIDMSASCYNGLDPSSDPWIADCFNDSGMHFSPNDMYAIFNFKTSTPHHYSTIWLFCHVTLRNFPGASDIQIDISGMTWIF